MSMVRRFFVFLILGAILAVPHASADEMTLTLTFYQDSLIFSQIDSFDVVAYEGYISTTEIGEPQLPQGDIHVAIPTEVVIDSVMVTFAETDTLPGTYLIWPVQLPDSLSKPNPGRAFVQPNAQTYRSSDPYPEEMVKFVCQGYLATYGIAGLLAYPVQYIPAQGRLLFHETIEFRIWYSPGGPPPARSGKMSEYSRRLYEQMVKSLVINPEDVVSPKLSNSDYDYVIITDEDFVNCFQRLADWKTKKGVRCTTVTTEWIHHNYYHSGSDKQERIREFIKDAVDKDGLNWGPTWILLGGDVPEVPVRKCRFGAQYGDIPCDLYYSGLDGNWDANGNGIYGEPWDDVDMYPDVFVGRACVNISEGEVEPFFVDKVLTYERWPPLTDYACNMLLMGFDLDLAMHSEEMKNEIAESAPDRFVITTVYDSHDGYHHLEALDALKDGPNLANHSDHGDREAISTWMGAGYYNHGWIIDWTDMAHDLHNEEKQTILYSVACYAAQFDRSFGDCIGEYFVNNPDGGGVAFIGNSRMGWYEYNNLWGRSFAFDIGFFQSLFKDNIFHIGQTLAHSKANHIQHAEGETSNSRYYRYIEYELNLLGDPEMPIWTDDPASFSIRHSVSRVPAFQLSSFDILVTDPAAEEWVKDAFVCVSGCGVYETDLFTDSDGWLRVSVSPTEIGLISVTVTKQNYLPHVSYIKATPGDEDAFVDVVIRDHTGDFARVPSWDANHNDRWDGSPPDYEYWVSPDILVDIDGNGIPGEEGEENPKRGQPNDLYARVFNWGTVAAEDITVEFWWADCSAGDPSWPGDFNYIDNFFIDVLPAREWKEDMYVTWDPDWTQIPEDICIWVRLICDGDPIISDDPGWEDNIGWKSFYIPYGPGDWWLVVIDTSGSMSQDYRMWFARQRAVSKITFIRRTKPDDWVALATFGGDNPLNVHIDWTQDKDLVIDDIFNIQAGSGWILTPLADAACAAADKLIDAVPVNFRGLILVTDGGENNSSRECWGPWDDPPGDPGAGPERWCDNENSWHCKVWNKLKGNMTVDVIYLGNLESFPVKSGSEGIDYISSKGSKGPDEEFLRDLADSTGGSFYDPTTVSIVEIPNTLYERFGFGHWDYEGEIYVDDFCYPYQGINPGDFFEIPIVLDGFLQHPVGGLELEVEFD